MQLFFLTDQLNGPALDDFESRVRSDYADLDAVTGAFVSDTGAFVLRPPCRSAAARPIATGIRPAFRYLDSSATPRTVIAALLSEAISDRVKQSIIYRTVVPAPIAPLAAVKAKRGDPAGGNLPGLYPAPGRNQHTAPPLSLKYILEFCAG